MMSSSTSQPQVLILPSHTSPTARVLTLSGPANSKPRRFFFCPEKGLYEFTKVAAPRSSPRSWLLSRAQPYAEAKKDQSSPAPLNGDGSDDSQFAQSTTSSPALRTAAVSNNRPQNAAPAPELADGYTLKTANLLVATPFDPLFLLLPILRPPPAPQPSSTTAPRDQPKPHLFHPPSEYLDRLALLSPHITFPLSHEATSTHFEARLASVCDSVEAGPEKMYRLSEVKLLQELIGKAQRVVRRGKSNVYDSLPPSMESRFVTRALERPITCVPRGEEEEEEEGKTDAAHGHDRPNPKDSSYATSSTQHDGHDKPTRTQTSSDDDDDCQPKQNFYTIPQLLRLHSALLFILQTYLPPHLSSTLLTLIKQPPTTTAGKMADPTPAPELATATATATANSPIDFTPLHDHLSQLSALRAQAIASRSHDDFGRKRSHHQDLENGEDAEEDAVEEAMQLRAEKKRKKEEAEEEEKRMKAGQSRAMRDLKKVDVTGMKKMSDFFGKKVAVAAGGAKPKVGAGRK
ncbi:MAG: hypothetical protein M1837_005275 [Sclerophora amabilis]|nr:MAG: hypothetical protein M1837_005275 [Sclerophora amabilis]